MEKKPILFVVAFEGYQQVEYGVPKAILEHEGYTVITTSDAPGAAIAKDGSTTHVDIVLDHVNVDTYDGIFFIGGPGAMEHLDNEASYKIIRQAAERHLPLGAICVSSRILAKSGILKGKQATGWNGDKLLEGIFQEHGVEYVHKEVVVDENIVTATGPSAAEQFGNQIVTVLKNHKGWG